MHCLGAVAGSAPSPNAGAGSRGGILSVFRALGVLVCEGRIQGPPRGYKEGPHCTPPMQPFPNNHVCEEDGYLCDRYVVLIREIADRTAFGSYLCVEILLCSDCPCGLGKATSKNPICPVPSLSISPWQQTSELLLEYWCISVVPSKGPETMNFQGLYQAVRSRLHFSQVAAWWSRSSGSEPRYIATRVVPYNEDNLRKFRETPTEHTFPLAGSGDGSSIKVTVWALPRMEEVPVLNCPLHPNIEKDEEGVARALTPTKAMPVVAVTSAQNSESLVMPALVDDRLQTPCNKPGKHHCHCEEEDVASPPSPSIPRPNGERKRRRSLPCGPAEVNGCSTATQSVPLPALRESTASQRNDCSSGSSSYPRSSSETLNNRVFPRVKLIQQSYQQQQQQPQHQNHQQFEENALKSRNNLNSDNLERCFRTQLSIEERDGNVEKRYKRTFENSDADEAKSSDKAELKVQNNSDKSRFASTFRKNFNSDNKTTGKNGLFENLIPFNASLPWSFVESWNNSAANGKCGFQSLRASNNARLNGPSRVYLANSTPVIDPFKQSSPFHESNPGPSTYNSQFRYKLLHPFDPACMVHQTCTKSSTNSLGPYADSGKVKQETTSSKNDESPKVRGKSNRDLHQMMSKLSFPEEKEKEKEEGGIFDWFSKVPGRVLGVAPNNSYAESGKSTNLKSQDQRGNEVKFKNCNLELSQREFDEVLAVLRARTPSGRRRAPLKTIKRRERYEKSQEDGQISDKGVMKFATNLDQAKGTCESCNHKYCKKKDHELAEKTTVDFNQTSYGNKNIYDPTYERQDKLASYAMNEDARGDKSSLIDGKQTANTADCLQTVSNKAEVLLGAILRTSKERKGLSDISNGTRSLSIASNSENDNNLQVEQIQGTENVDRESSSKIVPFDDGDKSLPLALNKKFNKFRQLFKKEKELLKQEKKKEEDFTQYSSTPCNNSINNNYNNNVQNNWSLDSRRDLTRESKAKRKIDFSNLSEDAVALGKVEDIDCSTNGAHQNSRIHSTNYKEGEDHRAVRLLLHSTNQKVDDEKSDRELDDQRERNDEKARKDIDLSSSLIAKSTLQNAFLSSKVRNNNHKVVGIEEDEALDKAVPSAIDQERFRRSLENAASMVFHSRTGLPLTSSPAPLRRGSCCFDYDSSLNSVSSKRSALFELNTPPSPGAVSLEETDKETENACEGEETPRRRSTSRHRPQSHALLGSFEESALNGRLEPVSTVHGFTAELGASGSFCPKHRKLPVTVFFYTLGDNDKVSTPYLAHINLGKKGYQVPRSGTIQVTLLNPLGTVVKMFVVLYDLSDMPPRSHTFLRQRTLRDKTLRYLVHLRFMSGKTGRIYLHTDIRMIICRKADVDTASDFGSEPPKELRSYIHGPTNPKFSPRC